MGSRANAVSQSVDQAVLILSSRGSLLVSLTSVLRAEAPIVHHVSFVRFFVRASAGSVMEVAVANVDERFWTAHMWSFGRQMHLV